jgi:hypothetical protein
MIMFFSPHCQILKSSIEQQKLEVPENILTENDKKCRKFKNIENGVAPPL